MNKKYSITIVLIGTLIALSIGYVVLNMGSAPQKNITKTLKQILSQEETRMSFSDENAKLTNKYDKLSLLEKNFDILQTKIEASNDIESTKKIQKELSQLVFDAIEIASSIAVQGDYNRAFHKKINTYHEHFYPLDEYQNYQHYLHLADYRRSTGQFDQAKENYFFLLELGKNLSAKYGSGLLSVPYIGIADIYVAQNQFNYANYYAYAALEKDLQNPSVALHIAEIYFIQQDFKRAMEFYSYGVSMLGKNPTNEQIAPFNAFYGKFLFSQKLYKNSREYSINSINAKQSCEGYYGLILNNFHDITTGTGMIRRNAIIEVGKNYEYCYSVDFGNLYAQSAYFNAVLAIPADKNIHFAFNNFKIAYSKSFRYPEKDKKRMYAQVLVAYAMYIYKSNNLEALTATNMYLSQALRLDSKKSKEQFLLIKQSKRDSFAKDSPEVFSKFVQK